MTTTLLWAGKQLTADEKRRTRRVAAKLRRCGDTDAAAALERFLPEHASAWTPDELEAGAHQGPWLRLDAEGHG